MIRLEKNKSIDMSLKNLLLSMIHMNEYLDEILDYNGNVLSMSDEKNLIKIMKKYNIHDTHLKYDLNILTENPYYKNIKLNDVNFNSVRYEQDIIKKRTLMNMDFYKPIGKYLFHYEPLGYFESDFELPVLKEDEKVWMSPALSEMISMNDGIEKGHGRCLTLGLGLGVIPYLWLIKDNVESVTVVEYNQDVIDLFEKYIRPQFKFDKELTIIQGNAVDYYNIGFLREFDYVYADFWESSEDGLISYMKLMEKDVNYKFVDFWIEDSILYDVKCIIASYLFTLYSGQDVIEYISSLTGIFNIIARKINRYFDKRNDIIRTEEQLLDIIHDKAILRHILSL